MDSIVKNGKSTVFFRTHSPFCEEASKELTTNGVKFIEVVSDHQEQEMPCIVSPRYADAFRGQSGVLKFLSLIGAKESIEVF